VGHSLTLSHPRNFLLPDLFGPDPTPLTSGAKLGEGIELRFAEGAKLSCHACRELVTDVFGVVTPAIVLRCENRRPGEWMGIEIDLSGKVDRAELGLRFCPAERLFPRIYYRYRDALDHFDEPDRAAPEKAGLVRLDVRNWRAELQAKGIVPDQLWVALQLPERPWFVAALTSLRRF
jgi:hypothetical protein